MKETMKKNLRFQQIRVISNSGFPNIFLFYIFFVDELQLALILFVSYLSILRMFLLLNCLFSLKIKKWVGVRLYPTWCSTLHPSIIPAVILGTTTSCTTFRFMNGRARG